MASIRLPLDVPGVTLVDPGTWTDIIVCDSQDHELRFATHRAHMVQGATDYCGLCAAKARQIYETLGVHLHVEELPLGAFARRLSAAATDRRDT